MVSRKGACFGICGRSQGRRSKRGLDTDKLDSEGSKAVMQVILGQHHPNACILKHPRETLLRRAWIKRDIGPASLEYGEQSHHHFNATLHKDSDQHLRTDAQLLELMSNVRGSSVQFCIGQRLLFKDEGYRIGSVLHLLLNELVHKSILWIVGLGRVPFHQQLGTLLFTHYLQINQLWLRHSCHRLQQNMQVL